MSVSSLSQAARAVIDGYRHFRLGSAVSSVPYFNNKRLKARAALRAVIGKGSLREIRDEAHALAIRNHADIDRLADGSLKKLLTDANLGLDCSAYAYYILDAESIARGKGPLRSHLRFTHARGIIGKIRAGIRPVENCDVATLADAANSRAIEIHDAKPGDMITMINDGDESEHDHILVISEIEFSTNAPRKISYTHAVAYPEDGVYGTGIKQGTIELSDNSLAITDGLWNEGGSAAGAERIFRRASHSRTELRRLNWF
ncbi:MAG: hypothetical protein KGI59_00560 [Patescibacteria group bacterium]|nr:hypothetical protein [Patescibacteria group bacterium]MDE2172405.1 hypothetical protein [Patescibacteria group bacterium]